MTDIQLHGIETVEKNNGPRPVQTIDTGVIGIIGTAPDADDGLWGKDKAKLILGDGDDMAGLGNNGTLPQHLAGIHAHAGRKVSQTVVAVRVEEGADVNATLSNILGSSSALTGMHALRRAFPELGVKPKLLTVPGFTSIKPTDGVSSITITEGGENYTSTPTVQITGGGGTGAEAVAIIDSETKEVSEIVIINAGVGYSAVPTVTLTGGGGANATATAVLGTVNNPVAVGLHSLCRRLRAGVIVDGPNALAADAIDYRNGYDSDRPFMMVDPFVKVARNGQIISEAASARVAGLQARTDYEDGFWHSPSNRVLEGVLGTARPIEHSLFDVSTESQHLNRNHISTVVRSEEGGFKFFGGRNLSSDPLNKFWSVRRAHDIIIESIEIAHTPFLDKPFNLQWLSDIAETVNAALLRWTGLGATLGGEVWLDPTLNTPQTWQQGILYISYDAEAPAPIERIVFMFNRNAGYYEALAEEAAREINRLNSQAI
ncbi:phage tail sheath subtilisin-like domain-containing protein [Pseudovibrio ascidiaceicola]|uniref:phage tail sheath subtilisin-like domain-containing protein n=1 Tax=Pseudovibrio ascidiaceicola TaxID=285279 RepID=UPI003D366EB7